MPNANKPVLGLFNTGNMSLEWSGPAASTGKGNAPVACTEDQRPANEPSLAAMTSKAIDLLDDDKRRGFFLQVEGASIDKQDHATNACGQIGETVAFDRAIGIALDYQEDHPDTLVVVTADHSHTSQIVGEDASGSGLPTGYSTNLLTKDGQTLSLTYGTAGYGGPGAAPVAAPPSQQHTGAVVPVWAAGPGALGVLGTNDHTDLFRRWAADLEQRRARRAGPTGPPSLRATRLPAMIVGFVGSGQHGRRDGAWLGRASSTRCCSPTAAPAGPPALAAELGGEAVVQRRARRARRPRRPRGQAGALERGRRRSWAPRRRSSRCSAATPLARLQRPSPAPSVLRVMPNVGGRGPPGRALHRRRGGAGGARASSSCSGTWSSCPTRSSTPRPR